MKRSMRRAALMALLGGLGFAALAPGPAPLVVRVAADASPFEVSVATERAILLAEAASLGWARTDPVAVQQIIASTRFAQADADLSDGEALDLGLRSGLDRHDPVVVARLLDRMERALGAVDTPPEEELRSWYEARADAYLSPPLWTVTAVLTDRAIHPEAAQVARARYQRLVAGETETGDPFHAVQGSLTGTEAMIASRLGDPAARAVVAAEVGAWIAPVDTAWGPLILRVDALRSPAPVAWSVVRAGVLRDWRREEAPSQRERRLASLRSRHPVEVAR